MCVCVCVCMHLHTCMCSTCDFGLEASLSRVLLSRAMWACACLGYLAATLAVVTLSCDGGVVEDECYQLLLAPVDT